MAHEKRERLSGMVEVLAASAGSSSRTFSMLAYTGAVIDRWYGRAVADLSGMEVPAKLPILLNHREDDVSGFANDSEKGEAGLRLRGPLLTDEPAGSRVARLSDAGFPLTASIGVNVIESEVLTDGQKAKVNGREVCGPITIWRKSRLFETSFVTANPADKNTSAQALAEERSMNADEFAKANPEAVKAWKDEGAKAARDEFSKKLTAFSAEFKERPTFAIERLAAGDSLEAAMAAERALLKAELAEARTAPKPAATNHVLDSLKQKAGNPGLGFDGNAREQAVTSTAKLPPAERAKAEFDAHPELAAQGVTVASLTAFYKAELRGQAKTDTVTRVAAAMSGSGA